MKPTGALTALLAAGLGLWSAAAHAHIDVVSGPGFAGTTQEIAFGVGHGCSGVDTSSVRIEIPPAVTSVRPLRSDFGTVSVETDASGAASAVSWQKPDADLLASDVAFYKLVLRLKVPNQPFTTLYFKAHQVCKTPGGVTTATDWVALPADPAGDGGAAEPAPALIVLPARQPGWNSFVVPAAIPDLGLFFSDALIVWKGTAAYSSNPATAGQIAATPGVTPLSGLAPNDRVWVRY